MNLRNLSGLYIDFGISLFALGCADFCLLGIESIIGGTRIFIFEYFLFFSYIGMSFSTGNGTSALPSYAKELFRGYTMHKPV